MVFDEKLVVMQVRPNYSIVYQFKPALKIERKCVKSQKHFIEFIKGLSGNWRDGDYFLKSSKGTFAYFNLKGSRVRLLKKSRTGREYLCWQFFSGDGDGRGLRRKRKSRARKVSRVKRKIGISRKRKKSRR